MAAAGPVWEGPRHVRGIPASPRAPGWGAVQQAMITAAQSCATAVGQMAAVPGDGRAAGAAERAVEVLQALGAHAARCDWGDRLIEAERALAVAEYAEAARAGPRRLRVL